VDLRGDASSGKGEERAGTPFNRGDRISPMISGGIRAKLSRYHSLFEPRRLSVRQVVVSLALFLTLWWVEEGYPRVKIRECEQYEPRGSHTVWRAGGRDAKPDPYLSP